MSKNDDDDDEDPQLADREEAERQKEMEDRKKKEKEENDPLWVKSLRDFLRGLSGLAEDVVNIPEKILKALGGLGGSNEQGGPPPSDPPKNSGNQLSPDAGSNSPSQSNSTVPEREDTSPIVSTVQAAQKGLNLPGSPLITNAKSTPSPNISPLNSDPEETSQSQKDSPFSLPKLPSTRAKLRPDDPNQR